ncbi:hypothetical protein F5146DRAFT_1055754 [Armillaria mellea]|nr:hypothetical protein F5146DRAFT_1055754 [Armillaria mellea]
MSTQCTICLCDYTEPVSIPCGHVYCLKCISDHILSSSPDGFIASCPTCRTSFCIVLPELKSLPAQFHRYITPSIRRVFVEPEAFKQRLDALEARNAALERENLVLTVAVAKEKKDLQEARKELKMAGKKIMRVCDSRSITPPSKRPRHEADSSSSITVPVTARRRLPSSVALEVFARAHSTKGSGWNTQMTSRSR